MGQVLLATTPESLVEIQPWIHPGTGHVVVSGSRLDHRAEILARLGISRPADEVGDAELLHVAWQRWGEGCADELRGDFAFAIWNPSASTLFCARDAMGVRPFYYHYQPGRRLVFASSTDAVLAQACVPAQLDQGRIADGIVRYTEGIDKTCTFYAHISRLPPAHTLLLARGNLSLRQYWQPLQRPPTTIPRTTEEWIEAQRDQVESAVRLRLRSHLPVGSMLSGGLDSSTVSAIGARLARASGTAFSTVSAVNLAADDCVETQAIKMVIEAIACDSILVDLGGFDGRSVALREWTANLGEPFDGSMPLAASVYRSARQHGIRAMMDGVPADNLFGTAGYDVQLARRGRWLDAWRARREHLRYWYSHRWPGIRAAGIFITENLPPKLRSLRRQRGELREFQREFIDGTLISREFAARIGLRERFLRYQKATADSCLWSGDASRQSILTAPYITAGIERYGRVASHFGIEPRPPFTDRDLIEFNACVPRELRVRDQASKWILRQAMQGELPPAVAWRTGREHLGWQFNRALHLGQPELAAAISGAGPLTGLLGSEKLEAAQVKWTADRESMALLRLQAPALLASWLESLTTRLASVASGLRDEAGTD
jgi:asparagine synthase (glutamine-hydrolysing)